jgi:predicted ATPase
MHGNSVARITGSVPEVLQHLMGPSHLLAKADAIANRRARNGRASFRWSK